VASLLVPDLHPDTNFSCDCQATIYAAIELSEPQTSLAQPVID
jgi:hypothetical protein